MPRIITDMIEVPTFTGSIRVVQAYLGFRDCLTIDACCIEFEQEVLDRAIIHYDR